MKTGLLQLGQRADGAGGEYDAIHQMVGQFGRERRMREFVRIEAGLESGPLPVPKWHCDST